MDYTQLLKERQSDFDAAVEHAKHEVAAIRTGRANPDMVADLKVSYLGSDLRLKELAAIMTPDSRSLLIQPWDKGALGVIERAVRDSSLGMSPVVDGTSVRLTVPSLTEERRKEYVRLLHKKIEEARIRIRQVREDVLKKIQNAAREKELREDDAKRAKDELQKIVDAANADIQDVGDRKEKELMTA